jgi:uncharacterized protein (TIGR00255 family)
MTGFARVRRAISLGEVTISVKSVNHRGLDVHIHTTLDLGIDNEIRAAVKRHVSRGHVEIRIGHVKQKGDPDLALNRPLFQAYVTAFREAAAETAASTELDVNAALRVPGMIATAAERELSSTDEQTLLEGIDDALRTLNQFREREGGDLLAVLQRHNERIREQAAQIAAIRKNATALYHARLSERLKELLNGVGIEPQRLAQEAALLADRSDINEETQRLSIHAGQLDQILAGGGEIGKKLDFLLQEMNRETNTILSKTNGVGDLGLKITDLALATKSEIEKIREQALNLE